MTEIKFDFEKENCYYLGYCPLENTEECDSSCLRYLEMFFLMANSTLPKGLRKVHRLIPEDIDLAAFEDLSVIKKDILNFVKHGNSLYIYSKNCGNGKTTWAIKLMMNYFDKIWKGNRFKTRAIFINVPTFMTKLRENISNKSEDFTHLLENLETVDLVIWDDIAACNLKEFDYLNLLSYIDNRIINGLSNIYTGNLDKKEMENVLGTRLTSRVFNNSTKILLRGEDRRGK